jgi:hypothetical protein
LVALNFDVENVTVTEFGVGRDDPDEEALPPTRGSDPRRIGFVLQTEVPFRVSIKAAEGDSEPPEMWTVAQNKLDETRGLIELSWTLGSDVIRQCRVRLDGVW